MLCSEYWFIVVCKANHVKKVSLNLTKLGIENYLPLIKELKLWHDRKKWIDTPAFGSYLFVKISEQDRHKVFELSGIIKFVFHDGKIIRLKNEDIENIHRLILAASEIRLLEQDHEIGDQIEIMNGDFKGLRGILLEKRSNRYLKVSLIEIGYSILLDVTKYELKKLNNQLSEI